MKIIPFALLCSVLAASHVVQADTYNQFVGQESGPSSWFDLASWSSQFPEVPGEGDIVLFNNPNTFGVVDTDNARVQSLEIARTVTDVQLDVAAGRDLTVDTDVVLGKNLGSHGTLFVHPGGTFGVSGDLTVGKNGQGTLNVHGVVTVSGAITIGGGGSQINLSNGGKVIVAGDQLDVLNGYLVDGKIQPNTGPSVIYDCTNLVTILYGPSPMISTGGITCPATGELTAITYNEGETLALQKTTSGELCALLEVNSASVVGRRSLAPAAVPAELKPVGRSYNGNDWEAYSGDFASLAWDCSSGSSCTVQLGAPPAGRTYVLTSYAPPSFTADDLSARFLEEGTFGPTRAEINSFGSSASANWVASQLAAPTTSHRAVFRTHLTHHHVESNSHTLLHTDACAEGARYRRYAFLHVDTYRGFKYEVSSVDSSKRILKVDGQTRSVVDGPVQCNNWDGPDVDLPEIRGRCIGSGQLARESACFPVADYCNVAPWAGQETFTLDPTCPDYEICWNPIEGENGRVKVISATTGGCDCDLVFSGVYGNPVVSFDSNHPPDSPAVDLNGNTMPVISKRFSFSTTDEMFQLTGNVSSPNCPAQEAVVGAPDDPVVGFITDGSGNQQYLIHTTSFVLRNNEVDSPLSDGGKSAMNLTSGAPYQRMQAACANAPRSFLNEDFCVLADSACVEQELSDVYIFLGLESLETIHGATGGAGGAETRYVYAVEGLRNEYPLTDYPCTAGARSRWMKVDDCSGGPSMDSSTIAIFRSLIQNSEDDNNELQDIYYPVNGLPCPPIDSNKFNFKVTVGGVCWENVHPDHHQVYDFTSWTQDHPGNGPNFNPIEDVAENPDATAGSWSVTTPFVLFYPDWHPMQRWHNNKQSFSSLGRLGDWTSFKNLPPVLVREDVALAFGSEYEEESDGKLMVCGSPFEVATVHDKNSGPLYKGGFDMYTRFNHTTWGLEEQRRSIFVDAALNAPDQLRQRMAWALSQILVVSPGSVDGNDYTEPFLSYYDIFIRHAFGNYFDILKEVTYHPLMAEMLTYLNGESTGYVWTNDGLFQKADENYAREVVQLFSIGLYALNRDGTSQVDSEGAEVRTYTNRDITEYAKVYTGFRRQGMRGNIEDPRDAGGWANNQVDPMYMDSERKDHFPKLGLNNQYIGDGYPLCSDLPPQHFLKAGATYRLLGSNPKPDLLTEPSQWSDGVPIRLVLSTSSGLASTLCAGDVNNCQPVTKFVLDQDIACNGIECNVSEPRTLQVAPGIFYEYVRPPCVNLAYYDNPQTIFRRYGSNPNTQPDGWADRHMCADPLSNSASTVCCDDGWDLGEWDRAWRNELFSGERVPLSISEQRCAAASSPYTTNQMRMCGSAWITGKDCADPVQGGCDNWDIYYWTAYSCSLFTKVNLDGSIAVVHEHGIPERPQSYTQPMVGSSTKMYFRAHWDNSSFSNLETFLGEYSTTCVSFGGVLDPADGLCQFPVTPETVQLFQSDADIISVDNILAKATIGAFSPGNSGWGNVAGVSGVEKFPANDLTEDTVFKFTDAFGRTVYRKNVASSVLLGNGKLKIRNPVSFFALPDHTLRDARYEVDTTLEHYFYHANLAPFLAIRFAQRFGVSNPSPRYVETIATAFTNGSYQDVSTGQSFGSSKYGCLEATIAAVLLDRESQDAILDADPVHGAIQEPYLKLIRLMRSLELQTSPESPYIRFGEDIQDMIGQEAHKLPNVFSFFKPEYTPAGGLSSAGLVSPEAQVLNGPTSVNAVNMYISLLKYGITDCYGGFGLHQLDEDDWDRTDCFIGTTTNHGVLTYDPNNHGHTDATAIVDDLANLLTSGRLSDDNRQIMVEAYEYTKAQGKSDYEALVNVQQLISTSPEFHTTNVPLKTGQNRTVSSSSQSTQIPYKAVIYLNLAGGADSYNMLVPDVCTGTNAEGVTVSDQYLEHRGSMAFIRTNNVNTDEFRITIDATGQPCSRFALHDELEFVQELYNDQDLLWVAGVGVVNQGGMTKSNFNAKTKTQLFAHNAMEEETKKVDPYDTSSGTGVLGRAKDVLQANGHVVNAINIDEAAIALDGVPGLSTPPIVVSSNGVNAFAERPDGDPWWAEPEDEMYFPIEDYAKSINGVADDFSGIFADLYSQQFVKGIQDAIDLQVDLDDAQSPLDETIWGGEPGDWDERNLWKQFRTVSKLMKTHGSRGTDRDTFYVEYGGFDHHDNMKNNLRPKLRVVNANLRKLVNQLKADNLWDSVVIVQTSEFARTITPNNNDGSDHGWSQHNMILGGKVKGGQVVGQYPDDITPSSYLDDSSERGRFIPMVSNDAIWNSVLQWFGVTNSADLDVCLPNRLNTVNPVEGTNFPLYERSDLFEDDDRRRRRTLRTSAR